MRAQTHWVENIGTTIHFLVVELKSAGSTTISELI